MKKLLLLIAAATALSADALSDIDKYNVPPCGAVSSNLKEDAYFPMVMEQRYKYWSGADCYVLEKGDILFTKLNYTLVGKNKKAKSKK